MSQKKKFELTRKEMFGKIVIVSLNLCIGLFCVNNNSYKAFFIAVLMQSINNLYDSFNYLEGYDKRTTFFQIVVFLGALISCLYSLACIIKSDIIQIYYSNYILLVLALPLVQIITEIGIDIVNDFHKI